MPRGLCSRVRARGLAPARVCAGARTLRRSDDAGVAHTEQPKAHAAWAVLAWFGRGALRPRGFRAGARTLRRSGDAGATPGATRWRISGRQ
eukprot:2569562-Pleurochrysis_carterae.AAC.1